MPKLPDGYVENPYQNSTAPVTFPPGQQYGFYFDQGRCIVCEVCMLACMNWNGLPTGAAGRWIRVYMWEENAFPNVRIYGLSIPCYHCENPVCVDAANGAMYKEPKYGAVLIDPAKAQTQSSDLRKAYVACPYGAIVFDSDGTDATASKCTMCIDRLEQNLAPVCVTACDCRAFEFGPLSWIQQNFGTLKQLTTANNSMPDPSISQPAVAFKAQLPRQTIVPYDANDALTLWQQRGPNSLSADYPAKRLAYGGIGTPSPTIPPVFTSASDVTDPMTDRVFKNKLVMHHQSNAELLYYTTHDE